MWWESWKSHNWSLPAFERPYLNRRNVNYYSRIVSTNKFHIDRYGCRPDARFSNAFGTVNNRANQLADRCKKLGVDLSLVARIGRIKIVLSPRLDELVSLLVFTDTSCNANTVCVSTRTRRIVLRCLAMDDGHRIPENIPKRFSGDVELRWHTYNGPIRSYGRPLYNTPAQRPKTVRESRYD